MRGAPSGAAAFKATTFAEAHANQRRAFLAKAAISGLALSVMAGCELTVARKNVRSFGKTFDYLSDPELREKEVGDATLTVEGAVFSGVKLEGLEWRNILFRNCDFLGAYEIGPKRSTNVRYEDCRFAGILSYGVCNNVHFLRCGWAGQAVMQGEKGSRNTVFEECKFVGTDSDPNHWGGVGTDGDARFVRCSAKWFGWQGFEKLELIECELDTSGRMRHWASSGAAIPMMFGRGKWARRRMV